MLSAMVASWHPKQGQAALAEGRSGTSVVVQPGPGLTLPADGAALDPPADNSKPQASFPVTPVAGNEDTGKDTKGSRLHSDTSGQVDTTEEEEEED